MFTGRLDALMFVLALAKHKANSKQRLWANSKRVATSSCAHDDHLISKQEKCNVANLFIYLCSFKFADMNTGQQRAEFKETGIYLR